MRCISCLIILSLSVVLGTPAAAEENKAASEASASGVRRAARDQEKRALHSLSQRINIEAVEQPLKEVIEQISQMTDRVILIDVQGLADEGISTDQNVTLNLGEMTVLQTFYFLLEPLQLTWVANDGILEITTKTRSDERLVTRIHDVRNLCKLLDPLTKELLFHRQANQQLRGSGSGAAPQAGGGQGGGGGYFSIPIHSAVASVIGQLGGGAVQLGGGVNVAGRPEISSVGSHSVEAMLASVINELSFLKWAEKDGEGGTIQLGQGCLIISQTGQGQLEIAGLLQAQERLVEGQIRGKSISARHIGYPVEEDAAIFEVLAKPKNLEIVDEELKTVLDRVGHESRIRVLIDVHALSDEGISSDQNVNIRISKLPLGIGLKKILDPLQLTYVVQEGVLMVTTKSRAESMMSIRLYDISGCWKITKDDPDTGLIPVLTQLTSGKWQKRDGEGGFASLISSRHLMVFQTQQVHADVELLIDDLGVDGPGKPAEPVLKLKVYTVSDVETATGLTRILPQVVGNWVSNGTSAVGTVHQVGKSLLINQTSAVHHRVEEILAALEDSCRRQNSDVSQPATVPAQAAHANP